MATISDYPVPAVVDGNELVAGWKDGRQVAIPLPLLAGDAAGAPGLSAYQLWRQAGNTGTVADFLVALRQQGIIDDGVWTPTTSPISRHQIAGISQALAAATIFRDREIVVDMDRRTLIIGGTGVAGGFVLASLGMLGLPGAAQAVGAIDETVQAALLARSYMLPSFMAAGTITVPRGVISLYTMGYTNAYDFGAAKYARVPGNPNLPGSFRTADRFMPDGSTSAANGGWWKNVSDVANICAFGAIGDNDATRATANTAAVNAAVTWALAQTFPCDIVSPPGQYQLNGPVGPITRGHKLKGQSQRSSIWVFTGNYDCITFKGVGSRVQAGSIEDMGLYGPGMTGGNMLVTDWTQQFQMRRCLVFSPFNFWFMRQSGGPSLADTNVQPCRGQYGLKAYGDGSTRNGEVDKIDLIFLQNVVIEGDFMPGTTPSAQCDTIWLDGYVQTLDYNGLRLFHGRRGIRTSNTPGVANPLYPSFIIGSDLEIEAPWQQAVYLEYCHVFWATGAFLVGSASTENVYIGPNARAVKLTGGYSRDAWLDGIVSAGYNVELHGFDCYRNAHAGTGNWNGVKVTAGTFKLFGGLVGKSTQENPDYTEQQAYGIANSGGTVVAVGVTLTGNGAGPTSGTVTTSACITA